MSHLQLRAADGHTFGAYLVKPEGTRAGAVVVIQEVFGVTGHIERVAEQYAAKGYLAIAPALFDRQERGVNLAYDEAGLARGLA
jgi:carboxymethylenebutenolidase